MINTAWARAAVLLVVLAGCIASSSSASVAFSSNVPTGHESQANATCGDQVELTIQMSGLRAGSMRVRVFDGTGGTAFDDTYVGGEGGSASRSLFGSEGEWTVEMNGQLVEGQASARISCD